MIDAMRAARSLLTPSSSPTLKPWVRVSVRMQWPGSYIPQPIVMTQPEGAVAAGDGGHALVVDAVLEVDDRAVVAHERRDEAGRPLGVRRT